jgi:polysaccharide biosynthesis protein PelF
MGEAPVRVLFVFAWLAVGGEETEARLLARGLDRRRWRLDVVACFKKPGMPEQTHEQLEALGVDVDTVPYALGFDGAVDHLRRKLAGYDLAVACQAVPHVYPALEHMADPPPLIEHGGLVSEALAGPKHLTARYIGVCRSIREAAASRMPGRPHHAVEIPSMVDLSEFSPGDRASARAELGVGGVPLVGWVGRLDRKKRAEDFIEAAALLRARRPDARFVVVGGPDAFMPEYAEELRARARALDLTEALRFLGDRSDVPRLLAGLDAFAWLSRGEGMPHVVSEAGATGLAVVATRDNGSEEQIRHGETGWFVPHEDPRAVAEAVEMLLADPGLRRKLGHALRRKVERDYSVTVVLPQWEALFEEVVRERGAGGPSI